MEETGFVEQRRISAWVLSNEVIVQHEDHLQPIKGPWERGTIRRGGEKDDGGCYSVHGFTRRSGENRTAGTHGHDLCIKIVPRKPN